MQKICSFLKEETVLLIAAAAAGLTVLLVPIGKAYLDYPDYKVLVLLFCLMAVVQGFVEAGFFEQISEKMLRKPKSAKRVAFLLVNCTFFAAMLVTNDVALLTFVPLTIILLKSLSQKNLIFVIVLQTIAANLGSMATPVGNPQNLYLYTRFHVPALQFEATVLPITVLSYFAISAVLWVYPIADTQIAFKPQEKNKTAKLLPLYGILFAICLLTVLRILDYRICFVLVTGALLFKNAKLLCRVDYGLLLTFVAFFIFVGNLGRIDAVSEFAKNFIEGREFLAGLLLSQIISNVPAAIMLSGFTQNWQALLMGVNIGGLGTLIASLASLISFKIYCKSTNANKGIFLRTFTVWNITLMLILVFSLRILP